MASTVGLDGRVVDEQVNSKKSWYQSLPKQRKTELLRKKAVKDKKKRSTLSNLEKEEVNRKRREYRKRKKLEQQNMQVTGTITTDIQNAIKRARNAEKARNKYHGLPMQTSPDHESEVAAVDMELDFSETSVGQNEQVPSFDLDQAVAIVLRATPGGSVLNAERALDGNCQPTARYIELIDDSISGASIEYIEQEPYFDLDRQCVIALTPSVRGDRVIEIEKAPPPIPRQTQSPIIGSLPSPIHMIILDILDQLMLSMFSAVKKVYRIINKSTGKIGGNGSGGPIYGELTIGCMQEVVAVLIRITGLNRKSRIIDIGCGLGKPSLHFAQYPRVEFSFGLEIEKLRTFLGLFNLRNVLQVAESDSSIGHSCFLQHGDIAEASSLDPFTHIYQFDVG